jgi:hypothetical protein
MWTVARETGLRRLIFLQGALATCVKIKLVLFESLLVIAMKLDQIRRLTTEIQDIANKSKWETVPEMKSIWLLSMGILQEIQEPSSDDKDNANAGEQKQEQGGNEKHQQDGSPDTREQKRRRRNDILPWREEYQQDSSPDTREQKRRKRNEEALLDKPLQLELRSSAGEFVVRFGQHKGKRIKELPMDYLKYILGVRQAGREFVPLAQDKTSWIKSNAMDCYLAARQFVTWRCWACGIRDTRFKESKLCTQCWCQLE